jgi:3-oxoacyl-[acyl-carrier-protein] synthase II
MREKIVITGIGIYSPVGKNKKECLDSLLKSKSGIKVIDEMEVSHLRNNKGGVIKDIDCIKSLNGLRCNIFLKHAVKEAIDDSKILEDKTIDKNRIGISVGTSVGGYGGLVDKLYVDHDKKNKELLKFNEHTTLKDDNDIIRNIPFVLLGYEIANEYSFTGPICSSVTACSASANAITMARDLILSDKADAVIVGGVDPITQLTYLGFNSLMAMTKDELKVMDEKRSGLLIGEGAAFMILERESTALNRNAKILCELKGCGISNDAYHSTQPHPDAVGAVLSIKRALEDAKLSPDEIDYINLHGTGTKHNDVMELKAIQSVFGDSGKIPISSSKSMMGHALGAAGAIEAVICIISLTNNILPPNINVTEKIKGYNYNLVVETQTDVDLEHILSNSFGFAGNCASLIFSRYKN